MLRTSILLLVTLAVSSCASGPEFVQSGNNQVEMLRGANRSLQVSGISFNLDGAVRHAQVNLRNLTESEVDVGYHFIWFDEWGEQVGAVERVNKAVRVPGAGMQVIRHVAPYPKCASFRLFVELQ